MRRLLFIAFLILMPVAVILLRRPSEEAVPWDGRVTRVGDVRVVWSPAEPLVADSAVRVTRRWAVPGDDALAAEAVASDTAVGGPQWTSPADPVVVGGTVYLLDAPTKRVHAVTLDGRWRGAFGQAGSGPGELARPTTLVALGERLVVLDGGDQSLEHFDTLGAHQRRTSVPGNGVLFAAHTLGGELLVNRFDGGTATWLRLSPDDGATRPFPMPGGPAPAGCRRTSTAGAEVLLLDCAVPTVAVLDADGTERARFAIDRDSSLATDAELAGHRAYMLESMGRSGIPAAEAARTVDLLLPAMRVRQPMRLVRRDARTGLYGVWEQGSTDLAGEHDEPAVLHLLSAEGAYLARVRFPEPWRGFAFVEGGLVALSVDEETGLVRLVRYQLTMSPNAAVRARRAVLGAEAG